jgi:N-acetylglucosamine-6-sulfatase
MARVRELGVLLLVIATAFTTYTIDASSASRASSSPAAVGPASPDVVMLLGDDMRYDDPDHVVATRPDGAFAWVKSHGVQFDKMWTANNLCCPGRGQLLIGEQPYHSGIQTNSSYHFIPQSVALWLQQAGYCTAFTGKYLNGYVAGSPRPPGYDHWDAVVGNKSLEYGYSVVHNDGSITKPGDYITDYFGRVALSDLQACHAEGKPAAIFVWPFAPHPGSNPKSIYKKVPVSWPLTDPSVNESDISDKPSWYAKSLGAPIPQKRLNAISDRNQARIRMLLSSDDALQALIDQETTWGSESNTLWMITSDNGFFSGEHRIQHDKKLAYEGGMPGLEIAGPGFPAGEQSHAFDLMYDVAPTILRATGVSAAGHALDGRVLQDVLADPNLGHDRFLPLYSNPSVGAPIGKGVRTWGWKYVRYANGDVEMYHLTADPYEMQNLAGNPDDATQQSELSDLASQAQRCVEATCMAPAPLDLQS